MIITEGQINALEKYVPNIRELAKSDDVQMVLDVIDDVIVDHIVANNDEPDKVAMRAQCIYDQIYNQN